MQWRIPNEHIMNAKTSGLKSETVTFANDIILEQFTIDSERCRHIKVENDRDRLGVFACLSGSSHIHLDDGKTARIAKGYCGAYTEKKGVSSSAQYGSDEPYRIISITMPPSAPKDLFGVDARDMHEHGDLRTMSSDGYALLFLPLSPSVDLLFRSIVTPPVAKSFQRVYMECKSIEILAVMLNSIIPHAPAANTARALSSQDVARLQEIRELLDNNLSESPSVIKLARSFGLTHNKLNAGFRELFGGTVYEYLRERRLNKARELLLSGECNVTEACMQVGYINLSHFAKIYRKKFGQRPGNAKFHQIPFTTQ